MKQWRNKGREIGWSRMMSKVEFRNVPHMPWISTLRHAWKVCSLLEKRTPISEKGSLMKAPMRLGVLFLLGLATGVAQARWVELRPDGASGVRLLESREGSSRLVCEVAGFESRSRTVEGLACEEIRVPGAAITQEAGAPELPLWAASVVIPDQGLCQVSVVAEEHVDLPLRPLPSKGNLPRTVDPASLPYRFGPAFGERAWPREQVLLREPYILRDWRGQTVIFQPFQYLAEEGLLRVFTRLEVEVTCVPGPAGPNALQRSTPPATVDKDFALIYGQRFLNYGSTVERYTPLSGQGRLLIICHDDFLDEMAPFVDWKRQKGQTVDLVAKSSVGSTSAALLAYVQAQYQSPGLASLLLVGDAEQMPSPSHSGGSSDPTYAMLAGNDHYPDILVGRFCAATGAQVATMVERCVEYERNPEAGADWYRHGTGIGSSEGAGIGDDGEADWVHMNGIRSDLLGFNYTLVDQIYDPGATAAMVSNAVNAGRSFMNYVGHGSESGWVTTGFSITQVNALANENRLPFIVDVACVNGQFAGTTCFAEAWMRATRNGNPIGAVGIYASTINQSWAPPMCAQDECTDLLVGQSPMAFGALCFNGAMRMNDEYADYAMTRTWTLFTDPTLDVRTTTPIAFAASHASVLLAGQGSFPVQTGVPGAQATLWHSGQMLGTAVADGAGLALIPLSTAPEVGQILTLTLFAHNRLTVQSAVEVISPAGAWVSLAGHSLDGDGLATPDEITWLGLELANVGTQDAQNLSLSLSSSHEDVLAIAGAPTVAQLAAGTSVQVSHAFQLSLGPGLVDGEALPFTLVASDGTGQSWSMALTITGQVRPRLAFSPDSLAFHALPGDVDSGVLQVANTGHAPLNWSLSFLPDPSTTSARDMSGSTISALESSFLSGASFTLHLSLVNASPDNEWALGASLQVPAGVSVVSSTDFVVEGGLSLSTDNMTGNGALLSWIDPDGGWGNIYPGETATATVELMVSPGFATDLVMDWVINGDVYGADPHAVGGQLVLTREGAVTPPWLSLNHSSGTLLPGQSVQVALTADALLLTDGLWTGRLIMESSDPDQALRLIPVSLQVGGLAAVAQLRIVYEGNCQSRLEWDPVAGATAYRVCQSDGLGQAFTPIADTVEALWLLPCGVPGTKLYQVRAVRD